MSEFMLPLVLIHVHPILTNVRGVIDSSIFDRLSVRQQMNAVCAYLEYVCMPKGKNSTPMKYNYGLRLGEHVRLLDYLEQYVDDLIDDVSDEYLSKDQKVAIRSRLLFKVTGTQTLPIIIGVDSENLRDRELYDRHM